jgi:hypothetical protein
MAQSRAGLRGGGEKLMSDGGQVAPTFCGVTLGSRDRSSSCNFHTSSAAAGTAPRSQRDMRDCDTPAWRAIAEPERPR